MPLFPKIIKLLGIDSVKKINADKMLNFKNVELKDSFSSAKDT